MLLLNTNLQILQNIVITLQNNKWNHTVDGENYCLASMLKEVKECNYVKIRKLQLLE